MVVNDDFGRATDQLVEIIRGRAENYAADRAELAPILANLLGFPAP